MFSRQFCFEYMLFQTTVTLYVNRLNTEESAIPYDYEHFDFCRSERSDAPAENLGQVVLGERIKPSPYNIEFMKNISCQQVCQKTYTSANNNLLNELRKGISLNYQHHWIIDNMPVTTCYDMGGPRLYCSVGFPMGCNSRRDTCAGNSKDRDAYYIYNHVDLTITYNSGPATDWGSRLQGHGGRIISAKVVPRSINHRKLVYVENFNVTS